MVFIFAGAEFLHLFAGGVDSQLLRFHFEAQFVRNLVFQLVELFALKLHHLVAIIANDVVVIRVIGVIRIVDFVILAEIHLVHQPALGEQRQRAIHRRAAHARVAFA